MKLTEQVCAQAKLLAGELDAGQLRLLHMLCAAVTTTLTARLRPEITPDDCKVDFVTAASLMALAELNTLSAQTQAEHFQAGDLTLKHSSAAKDAASRCLLRQAEMIIEPYLKDRFAFMGV